MQGDITTVGDSQIVFAPNVNAIVYFTGNVSLQGNGIFNDTMIASNLVLNGVQPRSTPPALTLHGPSAVPPTRISKGLSTLPTTISTWRCRLHPSRLS